ncbi:MAG: T9SS type A sorting domain-containing protein, partial [Saprospiraceae bacterium]
DTNYTLPVMTANGIATDSSDVISAVQYIYEATCAAPTWTVASDHDVYYIDSTGSVTVNFIFTNPNANQYLWDFGDNSTDSSTGNVSHKYFSPGSYSVGVTGCMTDCLPLNSCTSAIIDFEIRDTTSSLQVVSGDELGIKLFPNPALKTLNIRIPDELGAQSYQLLDISGRSVASGFLNVGATMIDINTIENGIYSMRVWNKEGVKDRMAILRLAVIK